MSIAGIHAGREGYLLLFSWVFAEQIGFPLPAAPALLAAGALAAGGGLNPGLAILVAVVGCVLADYLWYRAGTFRKDAVSRYLRRHPDSAILRSAERLVKRYGSRSLLFAKFVPGLSLAAPPLTGLYGVTATSFLLFDGLGALIWIGGFTGVGFFFGSEVDIAALASSPIVVSCISLAIAFVVLKCSYSIWKRFRVRPAVPDLSSIVARTYKEDPAGLLWLSGLITGDLESGVDIVAQSICVDDAANDFFAGWMSKWSRKLVIANSLTRVEADLRRSAQRTRSGGSETKPVALPLPEWPADHAVNKAQLQNALAAIDLFPRCAVLLTVFEKLSIGEASLLLGVDKKLVMHARTTGLTRLAYNLAIEQGWHAASLQSPESTLEAMKAAV